MATPTNITATLLASAQCSNGAGQVQWWQYEADLAATATTMEVVALRNAGPGGLGTMLSAYDGGGDALILNGSTTGLNLTINSTAAVGFVSQTNGAQGVAVKDALVNWVFTIVWAV